MSGLSKLLTLDERIASIEKRDTRASDLRSEIDALTERLNTSQTLISNLSNRVSTLEDYQQSAQFDPAADPQYQIVRTNVMPLAFAVQKVIPNADGARVLFHVGNISGAAATGGKIFIKWGKRGPDVTSENYWSEWLKWDSSLRSQEVEIISPISPGRWNKLEVSLPRTSPGELGHIEVRAEVGSISLIGP